MAIRTIDELMQTIKDRVGDSTKDEDITLIEDFNDSLKSFSESEATISDLRAENESLRQKYRDRFFSGGGDPKKDKPEPEPDKTPKTFDELFKEV